MKVYLAGPIAGLTHEEATHWRQVAGAYLSQFGIECFSPMRGKEFLRGERIGVGQYDDILGTDKALVARDRFDVEQSEVVLINLSGWNNLSLGTAVELGWASALGKLIIVVDPQGTWDHPFVRELASITVDDLQTGLEVICSLVSEKYEAGF